MRALAVLALWTACERSGPPPEKPAEIVVYGDPSWRMLGTVDHVAFSADEARIYVAAQDGALAAFDPRTGARTTINDLLVPNIQSVAAIDDHTLGVIGDSSIAVDLTTKLLRPLAVPPHTRQLAVAGGRAVTTDRKGMLQVVELATGTATRELERSRGYREPRIVGTRVIAGRRDDTVAIWDLESGTRETVFALGNGEVFALSPDHEYLALGSFRDDDAWTVDLYERGGRELARFAFGGCNPQRVAFAPSSKLLAIGCETEIRIVDVPAGTVVTKLPGPHAYLRTLAWSPRGTLLVAGGNDSIVHVWETARWQPRTRVVGSRGEIGRLAGDARTLVTVSFAAGSAWSWDVPSGRALTSFGREARALALDGSDVLLSLDGEPDRIERRSRTGTPIARRELGGEGIVRDVGPVFGRGAWQLRDGAITVFDPQLAPLWTSDRRDELVNASAVASPDGRRVALYGSGTLQLVDAIARRTVLTRPMPACPGEELAVSPDAQRIAAIDETGIRILDATTAAPVATFGLPTEPYDPSRTIAFADRDRVLALAGGKLVAWTIGTATATQMRLPQAIRLAAHGDHVYLARRDGTVERQVLAKLLATGSTVTVGASAACPPPDTGFGYGGLLGGRLEMRGKLDNAEDHQGSPDDP